MKEIFIVRVFLVGGSTELVYNFSDMLKTSKRYFCCINNENLFVMKNQIIKFEKVARFQINIINEEWWKEIPSKIMEMEV